MKTCTYCGRENKDEGLLCEGCGIELPNETQEGEPAELPPATVRPVNLSDIDGAFTLCDGFSRPEWPVILRALRQRRASGDGVAAWSNAISQWASRWEAELGENFWLSDSGSFFLLSEMDGEAAELTLQRANKIADKIRGVLGTLAWEGRPQSLIVHVLDESLADRFADAVLPPDHSDTVQFAALASAPHWSLHTSPDESVLAREIEGNLCWSSCSHLRLPYWLHEGVRNQLLRIFMSARGVASQELFDADLIPEHRRFWNEETIQSFWAGTCPVEHPEHQNLYYELARILFHLLSEKAPSLTDFLRCADHYDAGQAAARVCLKTDLNDLAGTFLGPGHWTPDPLAIAECWERARQNSSGEETD
jgi:hypothetical protein